MLHNRLNNLANFLTLYSNFRTNSLKWVKLSSLNQFLIWGKLSKREYKVDRIKDVASQKLMEKEFTTGQLKSKWPQNA